MSRDVALLGGVALYGAVLGGVAWYGAVLGGVAWCGFRRSQVRNKFKFKFKPLAI